MEAAGENRLRGICENRFIIFLPLLLKMINLGFLIQSKKSIYFGFIKHEPILIGKYGKQFFYVAG